MSEVLFKEYLASHKGFNNNDFICFLIRNHSSKELLYEEMTPKELIILMEADLLDETGALSIIWDAMNEGSKPDSHYIDTYHHLINYSKREINENPMVTPVAKLIWENKKTLIDNFIKELEYDLGIDKNNQ